MKTLREEIKDIMNERSSKKVKTEKLLKLGLPMRDVRELFFAERNIKRQARRDAMGEESVQETLNNVIDEMFKNYTFGVEIECYNVRPRTLIEKAHTKGVEMHHEGYNHRDNERYYKLVSDASLQGNDTIECVSPILKGDTGLNSLKATCDALEAVDAKVNKSCGLHVHVGGEIDETQYVNVFNNYYHLQRVINTFMADSRQNCRWAKPIRENVKQCVTPSGIHEALRCDRYHVVNPCSWSRHHTIEFRQHQGTTDYTKISNWARFCVKLVAWSKDNRLNHHISTIDDIAFLNDEEKAFFKARAEHFLSTR